MSQALSNDGDTINRFPTPMQIGHARPANIWELTRNELFKLWH